ncbi:MAG: hypothetical protein AAFV07_14565 [Bacteroidota bacterium]
MKHSLTTYGKNGVLKIKGNPQETMLYLRSKPIQYSWYAEVGSTWRYHIAQGLDKQAINIHAGMEEQLKNGIANEGEFLGICEYFNRFFTYGTYEYGHFELPVDLGWIEIPEQEAYKSFDYYGGLLSISPTQNSIDKAIVRDYKVQILKGARPAIVLLHMENSWMFYLLDGHHKFMAYKLAQVQPRAVIITKLGNDYPSTEETITLAKAMDCVNPTYLKWMKCEKERIEAYKNKILDLEAEFERINFSQKRDIASSKNGS